MRILIANDDGFFREGIITLEAVLTKHGHEVYRVAPHTEQSARSHAMTVGGEIAAWCHDDHHFSLEGTPADCVIYSLHSGLVPFPDVVIGGINHGYNRSSDTIYSGTCAVARQGAMYGIPGIAISAESDEEGNYDFTSPSEYLASHLEDFCAFLRGSESFLNINFPPHWNGRVEKAALGTIKYDDKFTSRKNGNKIHIRVTSCTTEDIPSPSALGLDMDTVVTSRGSASVTIIRISPQIDDEKTAGLEV
ncbi:MAG: 5'/3'-nucleotidase SurE [Candidatus Ornithospirochaeta sp.]